MLFISGDATHDSTCNEVLEQYSSVFSFQSTPVQVASSLPPATIDTGSHPLFAAWFYWFLTASKLKQKSVYKRCSGMRSSLPALRAFHARPKKDGTSRFCVDYHGLNAIASKDIHPLPHIQGVLDQLQGSSVNSTSDNKSGIWQLLVEEDSIPKKLKVITHHLGLYKFVWIPFGLTNSSVTFQQAMEKVLSGLIGCICMVYVDDVIFSCSSKKHAQHIESQHLIL